MTPKRTRRARAARSSRRSSKPRRYLVCRASEVPPGTSLKFILPIDGFDEECFLVNCDGEYHAYVNRCCHIPIAMDWIDNQFFTADGRYLLCQTHNACYLPRTGECIFGPPGTPGKALAKVPLEQSDGTIYASPRSVQQP
ncbi:MAG: Rieske 2Fe-2S domain-containing protein [Candidatus Binataceae bacterium]|nr:Rieske 2Fe-2S domain-containing protein [Candidatus Binataceae bacterium]